MGNVLTLLTFRLLVFVISFHVYLDAKAKLTWAKCGGYITLPEWHKEWSHKSQLTTSHSVILMTFDPCVHSVAICSEYPLAGQSLIGYSGRTLHTMGGRYQKKKKNQSQGCLYFENKHTFDAVWFILFMNFPKCHFIIMSNRRKTPQIAFNFNF